MMAPAVLGKKHLDGCVALFMENLARQTAQTSALAADQIDPADVREMLAHLTERAEGTVLTDEAGVAGYMAGWEIEDFFGSPRGSYLPEWAHATRSGIGREAGQILYRACGQRWVDHGCRVHVTNLLYHDEQMREMFSWNGFGYLCIDAVRKVEQIETSVPDGYTIRPARSGDRAAVLSMASRVNRHLLLSPVFRAPAEEDTPEDAARWIEGSGCHTWIAWKGGRAIGYMKCEPVEEGAAWIVRGPRSFAINGAYVDPAERAGGVARALLSEIMAWAIDSGMERCSVDFEAANIEGARFWLRHFQPVCVSMLRRLDDRLFKS